MDNETENNSGLIYLCNGKGEVELCTSLMGKPVVDICSYGTEVLALCSDSVFSTSGNMVLNSSFKDIKSADGTFSVGVSTDNFLYSWGVGASGELGLGLTYRSSTNPMNIKLTGNFKGVSCSTTHAVAWDENGICYAWGQNYAKQLPLHVKEIEKNNFSLVEELSFVPRIIPLSLQHPVSKVSCGVNFTVLLTRKGRLYSCGAGESGQLGTANKNTCAFLKPVLYATAFLEPDVEVQIVGMQCGWAHAVAVDTNGTCYSWGLNTFGQLGHGDFNNRSVLTPVMPLNDMKVTKVFSDGNSSAAITSTGRLFTWGSGKNYRLMHKTEKPEMTPRLVAAMGSMTVYNFAFSRMGSAAMVLSTLTELFPKCGPKKNFNNLDIRGFGLFESNSIVVKFTFLGQSSIASSKSCLGLLSSPNTISCTPPKLTEVGEYEVSISLNGFVFLPTKLILEIYSEFQVESLTPQVVNLEDFSDPKISPIFLITTRGIDSIPRQACFAARVSVSPLIISSRDIPSSSEDVGTQALLEFGCICSLVSEDTFESSTLEVSERNADAETFAHVGSRDLQNRMRSFSFQLVQQAKEELDKISPSAVGGLLLVTVALSLNGQDFSIPLPKQRAALLHAFSVSSIPSCVCMIPAADSELIIFGNNVISCEISNINAGVEAVYRLQSEEDALETEETSLLVRPAVTVDESRIVCSLPSLNQLLGMKSSMIKRMDAIETDVFFQITRFPSSPTAQGRQQPPSPNSFLLSLKPCRVFLFDPQPIAISPVFCRRGATSTTTIMGKNSPISFQSSEARVLLLRDDNDQNLSIELSDVQILPLSKPSSFDSYEVNIDSTEKSPDYDATQGFKVIARFSNGLDALDHDSSLNNTSDIATQQEATMSASLDLSNVDFLYVQLLLDGFTRPPAHCAARMVLFNKLTVSMAPSKTGSVPLSQVVLDVTGVSVSALGDDNTSLAVTDFPCHVRLKSGGKIHSPDIDVSGIFNLSQSKVLFTLPAEEAFLNDANKSAGGKAVIAKMGALFVGVSIDGGNTFDYSAKQILQIKL